MWPFVCVPGVLGEYMVRIGFFVTRGAVLCLAAGLSLAPLGVRAQTAEPYKPTIWIDPDGCEHWVMDDGLEGYMDNHLTREGRPVCRKTEVCGIMNTDQFFATDSARLSRPAQEKLAEFFANSPARAFIITGHTDSRASDEYNMRLSTNRARAVAAVGQRAGANIIDIRGYGERMPAADNASAEGRAKNRRVEILCFK